ncbi:unnamed protein product [Peniophora sp. CBMAI 1063]|nr:unnamed protein product [Peniophora sp. CBMAI 1063]
MSASAQSSALLATIPTGTVSTRSLLKTKKLAEDIKEALLFGLEGLSQSADAFPPLKSAVGGLLFIVNQIELVSNNKNQIREIYAQIDGYAASLELAVPDVTALSPAGKNAICAFAAIIQAVRRDLDSLVQEKCSWRFLRAKRHSARLQAILRQLDQADASFTRTMLASTDVQNTRILNCHCPTEIV